MQSISFTSSCYSVFFFVSKVFLKLDFKQRDFNNIALSVNSLNKTGRLHTHIKIKPLKTEIPNQPTYSSGLTFS